MLITPAVTLRASPDFGEGFDPRLKILLIEDCLHSASGRSCQQCVDNASRIAATLPKALAGRHAYDDRFLEAVSQGRQRWLTGRLCRERLSNRR
jgi:hypothetical protein